jgi:hypothetical protein
VNAIWPDFDFQLSYRSRLACGKLQCANVEYGQRPACT